MKKNEAEELKKLINSFVNEVKELEGVDEKAGLKELLSKEEKEKLFRGEVPSDGDFVYRFISSEVTGDKVFMEINGEERRWVPDPETLEAIGGKLSNVVDIPKEEMEKLKEGYGLLTVKRWNDE